MRPGTDKPTPFHRSFVYAWRGIGKAVVLGRNIRVQLAVAAVAVALGLLLKISAAEWAAVVVCIGMVCGGECMNTAVEEAVDLACDHMDPKAGAAKDMAAGAVLVASIASLVVGLVVFVPRLLALVGIGV